MNGSRAMSERPTTPGSTHSSEDITVSNSPPRRRCSSESTINNQRDNLLTIQTKEDDEDDADEKEEEGEEDGEEEGDDEEDREGDVDDLYDFNDYAHLVYGADSDSRGGHLNIKGERGEVALVQKVQKITLARREKSDVRSLLHERIMRSEELNDWPGLSKEAHLLATDPPRKGEKKKKRKEPISGQEKLITNSPFWKENMLRSSSSSMPMPKPPLPSFSSAAVTAAGSKASREKGTNAVKRKSSAATASGLKMPTFSSHEPTTSENTLSLKTFKKSSRAKLSAGEEEGGRAVSRGGVRSRSLESVKALSTPAALGATATTGGIKKKVVRHTREEQRLSENFLRKSLKMLSNQQQVPAQGKPEGLKRRPSSAGSGAIRS